MVDEYISRGKLLGLYVDGKYDTAEYHVPVPVIIQNIKDIPAEDVQPVKRGHWTLQYDGDGLWRCSECGSKYIHTSNFCSHCGADMREP